MRWWQQERLCWWWCLVWTSRKPERSSYTNTGVQRGCQQQEPLARWVWKHHFSNYVFVTSIRPVLLLPFLIPQRNIDCYSLFILDKPHCYCDDFSFIIVSAMDGKGALTDVWLAGHEIKNVCVQGKGCLLPNSSFENEVMLRLAEQFCSRPPVLLCPSLSSTGWKVTIFLMLFLLKK